MRWIKRLGAAVLALLLLAAAAALLYARLASPQVDGVLRLPGLHGEVQVARDADGVPTIRAGDLHDLMFALGAVHAQDRLWQLETHRRIAAGRLAEAFGPRAVDTDRFLRVLGARRAAAAQWQRLQGEPRAVLQAYADGVNAVLASRGAATLPPEFLLTGVRPAPWTPEDSLAWSVMMAWDLGGNWGTELLRLRLARNLPVARIDELLPPTAPGDKPLPVADYPALYRSLGLAAAPLQTGALPPWWPMSGVEGVGSNNWVVDGAHSTTGAPLLANDPHLKLSAPALWYLARLEAPGFKAAGATMPGLPLVVLGQNEHVAWGFTNTGPDVQDLYLERFKPGDATQVQTPEGFAPLQVIEEVIRVRGGADVRQTVRVSRHGPLVSDAGIADDVLGAKAPAYGLALRWTALDPDVEPVTASLGFNRARSVDDFFAASRAWQVPMQNMVVADRAGRIGFVAPGRVPLRRADNDLSGLAPAPGWDARYDWVGWVPADETPRERDPARGWIATANARVHAADYPHYLTNDWALPYRQQRIEQLLRARVRHSLDDLRALQADQKSLAVERLAPWLAQVRSSHRLAAAAQAALRGFDGTMAADKAAPLIHWAWTRQLTRAVFADELGALHERTLAARSLREALEGVLERNDAWWCDDKRTAAAETCAAQAGAAFDAALDELAARFGDDAARWQWGEAHAVRAEHRPMSGVPALARWFELRAPVGGDTYTVNAARVTLRPDPTTGELYLDEHGPSFRGLYDLADPRRSRAMVSTGQSGLPWSRHYRDLLPRWVKVEDLPLWEATAAHTLTLSP